MLALHARGPVGVPEAFAGVVPPKDDPAGLDCVSAQGWAEPPAEEESRRIGRDLDARTYLSQNARGLEQRDAVAGVCECVRHSEATETCADDDDVEAEGGATATVEGRYLFEGNVCDQWFRRFVENAHRGVARARHEGT
jgi:hypothetical protein